MWPTLQPNPTKPTHRANATTTAPQGTYTYEIFPTRVRIASLGVARGTAGVLGTVYSSAGPLIMDSVGPSGLFYTNAAILVCGCAACLLITRDTTGTTLS